MRAEQITGPVVYHGEGPVWSESWGGLRWVDMLAGDIMSLGADGAVNRRHVSSVVAVLRPREQGGAVMAVERGFALEDAEGRLLDNLDGLDWLVPQLDGKTPAERPKLRTWHAAP